MNRFRHVDFGIEVHQAAYDMALLHVAEKINNATSNGERQHWDTEILDQLLELSFSLSTEAVLDA